VAGVEQNKNPTILREAQQLLLEMVERKRAYLDTDRIASIHIGRQQVERAVDHRAMTREVDNREIVPRILGHILAHRLQSAHNTGLFGVLVHQHGSFKPSICPSFLTPHNDPGDANAKS
jgi:hypothetical protein